MPSRQQPLQPRHEIRRFTPEASIKVIGLLETRLSEVSKLDYNAIRYDDEEVRAIERRIRSTVLEVFGETSLEYLSHHSHKIQHDGIGSGVVLRGGPPNDRERQQYFAAGLPRTRTMLEGLIGTVRERTDAPSTTSKRQERGHGDAAGGSEDTVFVVHGRNEAARDAVARFIEKLGLKATILQEQVSEGRTIIEKLERHSRVTYAVVLLTGDDRGGSADSDPAAYQPRARQNVILELGYFVGLLTRSRVCVLYENGVEIPSDFHGVTYVPLDSGGAWRLLLAKEMKVAGLSVDLNQAMG